MPVDHEQWAEHWRSQSELCGRLAQVAEEYDDQAKAAELRRMARRAEMKAVRHELRATNMVGQS